MKDDNDKVTMELSFDGVDLVPYKCNCCNGTGFVDDGYIDVTEKRNCFSCNGKGIKYEVRQT